MQATRKWDILWGGTALCLGIQPRVKSLRSSYTGLHPQIWGYNPGYNPVFGGSRVSGSGFSVHQLGGRVEG